MNNACFIRAHANKKRGMKCIKMIICGGGQNRSGFCE